MSNLKPKDYDALYWLKHNFGGSVLISRLDDKDSTDNLGSDSFGLNRFKRLNKAGYVIITEEDPVELDNGEMFTFTPSVEITDAGLEAVSRHR
jgi:hypothetical protein